MKRLDSYERNPRVINDAIRTLQEKVGSLENPTLPPSPFKDNGFNELLMYDHSLHSPANATMGVLTEETAPATGDYLLLYAAEGDVRKVNWSAIGTGTVPPGQLAFNDNNLDELFMWDDSAGLATNARLANITTEAAPAAGDYVLLYGAEGDLRKVNWSDLGAGPGVTSNLGFVTPEDFGAVGDGTTDDTDACQQALDTLTTNRAVYLPSWYYVPGGLLARGPSRCAIFGRGRQSSGFKTDQNNTVLNLDGTGGMFYNDFHDFGIINTVGNPTGMTSQAGIFITPHPTMDYVAHQHFRNIHLNGLYYGLLIGAAPLTTSWSLFTNFDIVDCMYGMRWSSGSGTGNVIWGGNIIAYTNGIGIALGDGKEIVGDLSIGGIQFGANVFATGIKIDGGSYGGNIAISNCQWDAGADNALDLTRCEIAGSSLNYGGAVTTTIGTGCWSLRLCEDRMYHDVKAGGTTINNLTRFCGMGGMFYILTGAGDLTITGITRGYDGAKMFIANDQGSGSQNVILAHESGSSTAGNRINLPGATNLTLAPLQSTWLRYHTVISRWVPMG